LPPRAPETRTPIKTERGFVAAPRAQLPAADPAYQRAVKYLLNTQQADGSWYVKTRAMGLQPYFDAGFPYGFDQWISAAGTNWAMVALSQAFPATTAMASPGR
jgi:hypothetical protein